MPTTAELLIQAIDLLVEQCLTDEAENLVMHSTQAAPGPGGGPARRSPGKSG
jgi:hypothetical protein